MGRYIWRSGAKVGRADVAAESEMEDDGAGGVDVEEGIWELEEEGEDEQEEEVESNGHEEEEISDGEEEEISDEEEEESNDDEEEDSSDEEEDGGHEDEDDRDGDKGNGENRMLWTCTICNLTVNVFAREDHLISRPHERQAREQAHHGAALPPQPSLTQMWHCTVCNEEMNVFYQIEHQTGKQHLELLLGQNVQNTSHVETGNTSTASSEHDDHHSNEPPEQNSRLPDSAEPQSDIHLDTFYCIACVSEFPLSVQELHLSEIDTCEVCGKRVHEDWLKEHLQTHAPPAVEPGSFWCSTCDDEFPDDDEIEHRSEGWYCHLCNTTLHSDYRRRHLEEHEKLITASIQESTDAPPARPHMPDSPEYVDDRGHEFSSSLNAPHDEVYWECTICSERMDPSEEKSHLQSEKHLLLTRGKKVPVIDFYCEACERRYSLVGKDGHLAGGKHQKKVAAKSAKQSRINTPKSAPAPTIPTGSFHCEVCRKNYKLQGKDGHLNGQTHQSNVAARQKAPPSAKTGPPRKGPPKEGRPKKGKSAPPPEAKVYCAVCKRFTKAVGVADHKKNDSHIRKEAAQRKAHPAPKATPAPSAQANSVPKPTPAPSAKASKATATNEPYTTISGDSFYCRLCQRTRKVVGMEGHVKSKQHKKYVTAEQAAQATRKAAPDSQTAHVSTQTPAMPRADSGRVPEHVSPA